MSLHSKNKSLGNFGVEGYLKMQKMSSAIELNKNLVSAKRFGLDANFSNTPDTKTNVRQSNANEIGLTHGLHKVNIVLKNLRASS